MEGQVTFPHRLPHPLIMEGLGLLMHPTPLITEGQFTFPLLLPQLWKDVSLFHP